MTPTSVAELEEAVEVIARFVGSAALEGVGGREAAQLVRALDRGARVCDAGRSLAARRVAESGLWKALHKPSAAAWLAEETGVAFGSAAASLARGGAMEAMPELAAAATRGEVSADAAGEIARTLRKDRAAATRLLRAARAGEPFDDLRAAGRQARARSEDDAERAERLHAGRRARTFTDDDGFWRLDVKAAPEVGAELLALWEPWVDQVVTRERREGRAEARGAHAVDALLELARSAAGRSRPGDPPEGPTDASAPEPGAAAEPAPGPGAAAEPTAGPDRPKRFARSLGSDCKVLVRIDHAALVRGWADGDEVCEIVGIGPVPVPTIRRILAEDDPFLVALVTDGTSVRSLAHLGRRARKLQLSALEWLYPVCAVPGCHRPARLHVDHVTPYVLSLRTDVDDLQRLCAFHHQHVKTVADLERIRAATGRRAPGPAG